MTRRMPSARPCVTVGCDKPTRSVVGFCSTCQKAERDSVEARPCLSCSSETRREDRLCISCAYHYETAAAYDPNAVPPGHILYGGDWITGPDGIKRYREWGSKGAAA